MARRAWPRRGPGPAFTPPPLCPGGFVGHFFFRVCSALSTLEPFQGPSGTERSTQAAPARCPRPFPCPVRSVQPRTPQGRVAVTQRPERLLRAPSGCPPCLWGRPPAEWFTRKPPPAVLSPPPSVAFPTTLWRHPVRSLASVADPYSFKVPPCPFGA